MSVIAKAATAGGVVSPSVVARSCKRRRSCTPPRHREASQMPWRSEQEQQPGGLIETKMICFIQIATLIAFARND
ncbi:MAG: hypothetical protein K2N02_05445, partial [Alistipes sp.]|nr:hypothetical protein [Alistipes sp.]